MTMKRFAQAALALLFLLPAVPVAEATHLVPRDVDPQLPNIAEEPIFDTNIKPLRDWQIEAATAANRSLDPGRTGLDLAQERAEAEAWAQPLPGQVTLFTDRFEGDRLGAYGDWGEVGPNSWGIRTGIDNVTTTGILAKGRYPANAQSLLTTPELDLRTGFVDPVTNSGWQATGPAAGPAQETYADGSQAYAEARKSVPPFNSQGVGTDNVPKTLPQPEVPVGLSAIYRTIYQAIDNVVNAPATGSDGIVCALVPFVGRFCVPGPGGAVGGLDTDSRDGAYILEFQRRFNLARNGELEGRDGVRVLVFTQQPTLELAARCMEAADLGNRPANFVGQAPAFVASGPAGDEDAQGNPTQPGAIDPPCTVPRLLERDTAPTPLPTAAFNGAAAFTGYDIWRASAIDLTPWAERSVWIGFLFASGNAAGDPYFRNPALFNLDEDRNAEFFGYELDDLRLTAPGTSHSVRVRPIDDPWYVPFGHDLPTIALGDPLPFGADIANVGTRPVDIDNLTVRVFDRTDQSPNRSPVWEKDLGTVHLEPRGKHRVDEAVPCTPELCLTAAPAKYTVVVDALRSRSTGDAPEADPRDSIQTQDVDVRTVRHLVPGNVERSAATFAGGDTASFTLRLRNEGNAPVETVAVADLVNVVSGSVIPNAPFAVATPRVQAVTVPPEGPNKPNNTVLRWDLALPDAGQYKLFVRLDDSTQFNKTLDLLPKSLQPQPVLLLAGPPPTVNGILATGEWPAEAFRNVTMRDLYDNGIRGSPTATFLLRMAYAMDASNLYVAFDMPTGQPGPLSVLIDDGGSVPVAVQGLVQTVVGTRRMAEASIPLLGQPFGLAVGPGGSLRLVVSAANVRYPWAPIEDGEGLQPPNKSLQDELATWLPLRLTNPLVNPPHRLLSLGIGVDRAPPPMLELDMSSCSSLAGWTQGFIHNPRLTKNLPGPRGYDPDAVKWNCAPYGKDGKSRLYEGRTPLADCGGQPCGQWSRIDVATPSCCNLAEPPFSSNGDEVNGRRPNVLASPSIEIPAIPDPYLILRHQYATEVYINDEPGLGLSGASAPGYPLDNVPLQSGVIRVPQQARVYLQEANEVTEWGTPVLLRPEGGMYTTQELLGIQNPDAPRTVLRPGVSPSVNQAQDGWWWPTGEHPFYRPVGSPIVSGQTFSGSPWKVDRIPLFGSHGDRIPASTPVDVAGKTIRLLFVIENAPGTPLLGEDNPRDFGWRIEGLAVAEGPQFARDLAVTAVQPVTPLYDPAELGLGPGTTLQVNVTVANRGTQAIEGLRLCVRAIDLGQLPAAEPHPCSGPHVERELGQRLQAGTSSILNLTMTVPNTSGARLSFVAGAFPTTGDDFISDNLLTDGQVFEVRASPNLAVTVGTDQRIAPPGQARSIFVHVENRGNVRVTGFTVQRGVAFEDGSSGGTTILGPDTWTADDDEPHGTLDVGEAKSLDAIATTPAVVATTDLRMPGVSKAGAYLLSARVQMPGDIDPTDDNAVIVMRTQDILQDGDGKPVAQTFADPSAANGLVVDGTPGIWSVPFGGSLVAGDPATGEIPLAADGTVELTRTPIDLRSARQATLSIKHRYDLEAAPGGGFDAGRVEISTDDGVSWRPLRPEASPLQGLPDGYPSIPITGDSGLAATTGDTPAVAFTGKSADIPGAQDGWIRSQFDLAQDPDLSRRTAFDAFSLAGFPAAADKRAEGTDGNPDQFFSSDWILREPNAQGRFRYWWIENLTNAPEPHSGSNMWWSGTAGLDNREEVAGDPIDPIDLVQNQLDYAFTAQPAPASLTSGGSTDVLMTWWQWRAGDADGGTGSRQTVSLRNQTATLNRPVIELEQEATGWKRWGVSLNGLENQPLTLRFDYDSAVRPGFAEPATANNHGWFLDDFQQVGYRFDERRQVRHSPTTLTGVDELETVDPRDLEDGTAGPWSTRKVNGAPPRADIVWSLVGQGAGARDGGWKVGPVNVPGQGEVPGWRFADASKQGYPYAAESRLVTPLVDLSQAGGELRLRFDHQYWFEARTRCPLDQVPDADPLVRRSEGCFLSAIDGGAVEYQTFDPATQSFGPWQALAQGFDDFPQRLYFDAKTDDCSLDGHTIPRDTDPASAPCSSHHRVVDRLSNLAGNRDLASFGGYPAIEERGARLEGLHDGTSPIQSVVKSPVGHGTSLPGPSQGLSQTQFERHPGNSGPPPKVTQPWANHPISFVFSGPSKAIHPDTDGWASEAWDVSPLRGKQVRFAFHAASNPGMQSEEGRPSDPADRGWSLANLRVEGDALDGKPVRLRLRVATDSSLGAGEWRIDEAVVAGERFNNNAAILADGPLEIVADHGATVKFNGRFATLGNGPLQGIVATLSAVRESDLSPYPGPVEVKIPSCAPGQPPQTCLAAAIEDPQDVRPEAIAAFRLKPLDLNLQPSIPFSVSVQLPGTDEAVLLRWSLWRDLGGGNYAPFPLDVPGNAQAEWVARSLHQESVSFLPPVEGQSRLLVTSPADALPGEKIALAARIENTGTTEPVVKAHWTVERVLNKGNRDKQPYSADELVDPKKVKDITVTLKDGQAIARGEQVDVPGKSGGTFNFTPPVDGLYRITLEVATASGDGPTKESVEILVGLPSTYHATDFSAVDAVDAGWLDASVDPRTDGGGSPDGIRFRAVDGLFLWGTTDAQFGAGQTYCSQPSTCSFQAAKNEGQGPPPPPPPPVKGLEGRAFGPAIRLDRVPQGQAFVTLRHNHNFQADDGARIEFLPLDSSDVEAHLPAFQSQSCPGGAVTFTLPPMRFEDHSGMLRSARSVEMRGFIPPMENNPQNWVEAETSPDQHNPLLNGTFLPQRAIGGPPARDEVVRYDLSSPAIATCGEPGQPSTLALVNYTVLPLLHVGTRPGYVMQESSHPDDIRVGAQGWGIRSIQVSSVAVDASPAAPTYPVQVGAPKTFFITVTNLGQVEDRFGFTIDAPQSTLRDPDWVSLPEPLSLAPGESRRIPVRIDIPANDLGQPGSYLAPIQVYSLSDPFTTDTVAARVDVRRVLLPDLALTLTSDLPTGDGFEAGKVYPVHATIFNIGGAVSRPTELLLETVDAAGETRLVERLSVARLCPPGGQSNPSDGCQASRATLTVEWAAPQQPGAYRLVGRVDPAGVIDEDSESNNVADLGADVSPLNEPDLAVTDLKLQGVTAGVAEEGSLVVVTANATNFGNSPAHNVRVKIRFGSSTIREVFLPTLDPGQQVTVSAAKVVSRGQFIVGASITHDAVDANIDDDDLRLPLRVRGHELALATQPANLTLLPGGTVAFRLNITNHGNSVERAAIRLDPAARGWAIRVLPNPLTIAPDQTGNTSIELTAPSEALAGPTIVWLLATPSGHAPSVARLAVPLTITARPGVATLDVANQTVHPGNATILVRINSTSNAAQTVVLELESPTWAPASVPIALAARANRTVSLPLAVPANATVGSHDLTLLLRDAKGAVLARHSALVNVTGRAAASAAWSGAAQREGDELGIRRATFTLRVSNDGNLPLTPRLALRGLGEGISATDIPVGPVLAPGETWRAPVAVLLAPNATAPFGLAEVWIDSGDNATQRATVLALPGLDAAPDLHVAVMQMSPRVLQVGRAAYVSASVENRGGVEAPASTLFVSVNGYLVEPVDIPAIPAGSSHAFNVTVTFTEAGSYLVSLLADGDENLTELEDADNGRSIKVEVGKPGVADRLQTPGASFAALTLALLTLVAAARRRRGGSA